MMTQKDGRVKVIQTDLSLKLDIGQVDNLLPRSVSAFNDEHRNRWTQLPKYSQFWSILLRKT